MAIMPHRPKKTHASKYPELRRTTNGSDSDVSFYMPWSDPAPYLQAHVDHEGTADNSVRVMRSSPESMTLQIRTLGAVSKGRRGKPRPVYSQFTFNRQGMLRLAAEIERVAKTLPEV